jgi:hypothetical protein
MPTLSQRLQITSWPTTKIKYAIWGGNGDMPEQRINVLTHIVIERTCPEALGIFLVVRQCPDGNGINPESTP